VALQGKKTLITGVTGLIGRGLAHVLAKENEVHGVARFSDPAIRAELEQRGVRLIGKDLGEEAIGDLDRDYDVVFNQAVVWGSRTKAEQDKAFRVNVYLVGDLMRHFSGTKARLVLGSTGGVYEKGDFLQSEDDTQLGHNGTYVFSKVAMDVFAIWAAEVYQVPTIILRYYWPYAPYRRNTNIAAYTEQILQGRAIEDNPQKPMKYCFTYIGDVVELTIRAAEAAAVPAVVVNCATDEIRTVKEAAEMAARLAGVPLNFQASAREPQGICLADTSKMKKILGAPRFSLEEGLRRVIRGSREGATQPQDWMFE